MATILESSIESIESISEARRGDRSTTWGASSSSPAYKAAEVPVSGNTVTLRTTEEKSLSVDGTAYANTGSMNPAVPWGAWQAHMRMPRAASFMERVCTFTLMFAAAITVQY
jgi:hypothetical protein